MKHLPLLAVLLCGVAQAQTNIPQLPRAPAAARQTPLTPPGAAEWVYVRLPGFWLKRDKQEPAPYFVDPDNANPLLRNFNLTADSTQSIGQGFAVPLSDDFSGNLRTAPYDIGAFEYSSGDTNAPSSPTGLGVI